MSPTYTAPAIETIHQGEQLLTGEGGSVHDDYSSHTLEAPRERTRPLSSRSETYGRKHRSGSPQVHPYLKASPVAEDTARRANIRVVPEVGLRRHASADFSLLKDPRTGFVGVYGFGDQTEGQCGNEIREQKWARRSPSPRRPTASRSPSYRHAENVQPERPNGIDMMATEDSMMAASEPAADRVSTGTPAEALRFLEGGAGTEMANHVIVSEGRPSWSGHDEESLSPTQRSSSSASSHSSSPHSVASSQTTADTELTTGTTRHDLGGEDTPVGPVSGGNTHSLSPSLHSSSSSSSRRRRRSADPDRYGTPEMPRGPAKLPHIPTQDLTPRVPNQSHHHPKHLPRAEKLPLSGYELLASTISSSPAAPVASRNRMSAFLEVPLTGRGKVSRRHSSASASLPRQSSPISQQHQQQHQHQPQSGPLSAPEDDGLVIKPIYRRFESLNHRLLLNLQDELSELEEQLHRLDTTDTQTRRLQSSILPASRRAEFLAGGELQWHKTDILNKIAFKLGQYNHTLSSFTAARDLPAPALAAVTEYRDYLATHRPISDVETRFLDSTDDLVTLEAPIDNNNNSTANNTIAPFSSSSSNSSSSSSTLADSSEDTPARHHHHRAPSSDYLHSLRLPPDEPIVKPIPGTMHGNSWLVRHKRISRGSGSGSGSAARSRCSSAASTTTPPSPRFLQPGLGSLHNHDHDDDASPRLLPPLLSATSRSPRSAVLGHKTDAATAAGVQSQPQQVAAGTTMTPPPRHLMVHLALAMAVAVLVPILTFSIIPGFVARMIVVLLVGLWVAGSVAQSVDVKRVMEESKGDLMCSGAVYAGVMVIVAGVMA